MKLSPSSRLNRMGSAVFAELAEWKREAAGRGLDIIDLGIGSPDRAPSPRVMETLRAAVQEPYHYGYPSSEGSLRFRTQVARWYAHRFGVQLDPEGEVLTLMGSQDGLAHLALALTEPGDAAFVPDPGYPIYAGGLAMAGVEAIPLALKAENGFLPKLEDIPEEEARRAKFILLNYPSNPVAAVADRAFFERLIDYAKTYELWVIHDLAYSELAFDGFKPCSLLEIPGAKDVAVEFHSLSKSFNMAGCRLAFLAGNPEIVKALRMLKGNIDYGVFQAVQEAGIAALQEDIETGISRSHAAVYERRRDVFIAGLGDIGWEIPKPKATMFVWAPIPSGWTSRQISREMLTSVGVVAVPGDAFGKQGEGYVRLALVQEEERLVEAVQRIGSFLKSKDS